MFYNSETKILIIPPEFNEELKYLPENVVKIDFAEESLFNQEIKKGILPNTLKVLDFSNIYNQEIKEGVIPTNLHTIKIGYFFNKNIVIPESVKKIQLWSHNNIINNLPFHIEKVKIVFQNNDREYVGGFKNTKIDNLPPTLTKIVIEDEKYMIYLTKIPYNCKVQIKRFNKKP